MGKKPYTEEIRVAGVELVGKVKEIIRQGKVRRITIKDEQGKILLAIPLAIGIAGALLLPFLSVLGVLATLVSKCSIVVEKEQ